MTKPLTYECNVHFRRRDRGRREMVAGTVPVPVQPEPGRIPRIARFMALAIRFDEYIRSGRVTDQSDLAQLGHVSRARISQIMNLLNLAPDIQEAILFLPRVLEGRDRIHLRQLQSIASVLSGASSGFCGND